MKRNLFVLVIVALIISLFPAAAMAAKPAELEIEVRNQTGASVDLSITDEIGNIKYLKLPAGTSYIELTEGKYTYFAATICGNQSGPFNAVKGKLFFLTCMHGTINTSYKNCQFVAFDGNQMYDPHLLYKNWKMNGYPHGYEESLIDAKIIYGVSYDCLYGVFPIDYWDGVKPTDEYPGFSAR